MQKHLLLSSPSRQELDEQLWEEKGWDILCFFGHSSSEMNSGTGYIYINDTDKLSIPELKNSLQHRDRTRLANRHFQLLRRFRISESTGPIAHSTNYCFSRTGT